MALQRPLAAGPSAAKRLCGTMAAYHWEARRRQMLVERRLRLMQDSGGTAEGRQHQQVPREIKEKTSTPLPPNMMSQNPSPHEAKTDPCPCNTNHVQKHSGKLLKRYSTTEYIQQW